MIKLLIVAWNDYRQTVVSKTFIISIILMPVLFGGMVFVNLFSNENIDLKDKRLGIIDRTNILYEEIESKAEQRNQYEIYKGKLGDRKQVKPKIIVEQIFDHDYKTNDAVLGLSDRVRGNSLFGFLIIGQRVVDDNEADGESSKIIYYTDSPSVVEIPDWFKTVISEKIEMMRFEEAGVDKRFINKLMRPIDMDRMGLAVLSEEGKVIQPKKDDPLKTFGIPFIVMILIFVTMNMSAPMMLNTVMEEKMQKIAEVLVASISPFHLMLGKLLAATLVGLTFSIVYISGLFAMLIFYSESDLVPISLYFWFYVFLVLGLLSFGSMWAGIGAACSEMKDTQNFAGLTVMMIAVPVILGPAVIQSPSSTFSVIASLIPPFTPLLMLVRMAIPPGPALWEVALGLILCISFTLLCVWAGGKIFRIGILAQGQTPSIKVLIRWIFFH